MKLNEYINSGILEEFCMGVLSEDEATKVAALAKKYPPIQEELDRIQDALEFADRKSAVSPSKEVKEAVMASIAKDLRSNESYQPAGKSIKHQFNYKYAFAASLTGFLIACAVALYLNNELNKSNLEISQLNSEITNNKTRLAIINQANQELNEVVSDGEFDRISLKGLQNFPEAEAVAYRKNEQLLVSIGNLPEPPAGMQYQFWAIVDGTPISAGLFDYASAKTSLTTMKNFDEAVAFAISLEEAGGKESPTAERIYVLGNV
ncbi:MAG: anti-sigma factor [Bacteroidota bacterium]